MAQCGTRARPAAGQVTGLMGGCRPRPAGWRLELPATAGWAAGHGTTVPTANHRARRRHIIGLVFLDLWSTYTFDGRLPWLIPALVVAYVLVQRLAAPRRPRLRLHVTLVALAIVSTTIAASVATAGYAARQYLVAAFAFELFAAIALTATAAFHLILPRIGLTLPRILTDILAGVAVIIALIAIGQRAGLSLAGLITTSAVLTAVIGFALQDTLGNMMGGIALQLDNSIKVGDWITLPGMPPGRVSEIRWRYTALETVAWTTVIVPNSMLMKGQVTVLGRRHGEPVRLRRDVDFHVELGTPPNDVIEAVRAALLANPVARMATEPPVQVLYFGFKDSLAWYRVRYWLDDLSVDDPTDAEVRTRVYYALRRAGLSFTIPAQTVLLTARDEAHERRVADAETARRLDAIAGVDLLAILGDEERRRLAARLHFAPFARGEAMTREGDSDDGLYMIVEGEASVRIGDRAASYEVARLHAGQFFGEMSLLTGEKRSATVIAHTDVVTYRLDKHAFEELVTHRPEIADAVAELLTERKVRLDAARENADEVTRARRRQSTKQDILGRIKGFFNLSGS